MRHAVLVMGETLAFYDTEAEARAAAERLLGEGMGARYVGLRPDPDPDAEADA